MDNIRHMPKINAEVSPQLMNALRKLVIDKYGTPKGNMSKAIKEALIDYLKKNGVEIGEWGNFDALIPALA